MVRWWGWRVPHVARGLWFELSTSIKGERPQTFPVFSPRCRASRKEGVVGLESCHHTSKMEMDSIALV